MNKRHKIVATARCLKQDSFKFTSYSCWPFRSISPTLLPRVHVNGMVGVIFWFLVRVCGVQFCSVSTCPFASCWQLRGGYLSCAVVGFRFPSPPASLLSGLPFPRNAVVFSLQRALLDGFVLRATRVSLSLLVDFARVLPLAAHGFLVPRRYSRFFADGAWSILCFVLS